MARSSRAARSSGPLVEAPVQIGERGVEQGLAQFGDFRRIPGVHQESIVAVERRFVTLQFGQQLRAVDLRERQARGDGDGLVETGERIVIALLRAQVDAAREQRDDLLQILGRHHQLPIPGTLRAPARRAR